MLIYEWHKYEFYVLQNFWNELTSFYQITAEDIPVYQFFLGFRTFFGAEGAVVENSTGWVELHDIPSGGGVRMHFWFWNVFKRNPDFSILFFTQIKMSSKQYLKARYSLSFLNCYKSDTKQDVIKRDILIHDNSYVLIS